MKCPMLSKEVKVGKEITTLGLINCLKEECAWWEGHGGFCAILKICRHLEGIDLALDDIAHQLPTERKMTL